MRASLLTLWPVIVRNPFEKHSHRKENQTLESLPTSGVRHNNNFLRTCRRAGHKRLPRINAGILVFASFVPFLKLTPNYGWHLRMKQTLRLRCGLMLLHPYFKACTLIPRKGYACTHANKYSLHDLVLFGMPYRIKCKKKKGRGLLAGNNIEKHTCLLMMAIVS